MKALGKALQVAGTGLLLSLALLQLWGLLLPPARLPTDGLAQKQSDAGPLFRYQAY